jgi:hypothetical protein
MTFVREPNAKVIWASIAGDAMSGMDIAVNLVASLIWVMLAFAVGWFYGGLKYRHRHNWLNGKYGTFDLAGEPKSDSVVIVRHRGRRGVSISCKAEGEMWESRIIMSEDIPEFGQGIYQYDDKADCGIHRIQTNKKDGFIYVFWQNTSHGSGNSGAHILKPIGKKLG